MKAMSTIALATGAAFFYMAASWMMKEWGASSLFVVVPAVLLTLAVGVFFEIEVLKVARLGHVIVLVLAIELVMTFLIATTVLGESYSPREMLAVAVIAFGIGLLSWRADAPASSTAQIPAVRPDRG
jgi:drug/metabolite transporter (DMT)-like permease